MWNEAKIALTSLRGFFDYIKTVYALPACQTAAAQGSPLGRAGMRSVTERSLLTLGLSLSAAVTPALTATVYSLPMGQAPVQPVSGAAHSWLTSYP